ncbi:MAG: metallophosphoesterase [Verrucomicrobia bacterium]|nr:metallophosphoesterase [Verrucomicrobiota bacterium]
MNTPLSRRHFIRTAATATGLVLAPHTRAASDARPFSFVLLGDLHYDRLEHHDLAWLDKTHPNDLSQIKNYSKLTAEIMPRLFTTLRDTIAELNRTPATRVDFVLQVGDVVEGLCGSEELSVRQNTEALAFLRDARLGVPFLFAKGNHDITGDGAPAAFAKVFHPFLTEQARALAPATAEIRSARYTVRCGNAEFAFFDAYDRESLAWFEAAAAQRSAGHFFAVIHPPVVPYGARATWHLFSGDKDRIKREKLLELLGHERALVLGGHIHRFNTIARETPRGRFAQLAVSSVINTADTRVQTPLSGLADYTGDQIRVEPKFSPETEPARRAVYDAERPFVKDFEYADLPGYAIVTVDGPKVTAKIFPGLSRQPWKTVDLTRLLAKPV